MRKTLQKLISILVLLLDINDEKRNEHQIHNLERQKQKPNGPLSSTKQRAKKGIANVNEC